MFSIIMPVWNRADYVAKAIDSVLAQTFEDYELLIVDDGSRDNLEEVVKPYLCERVKYYRIPHSGVSKARNFGLKNARYPLIAYLDSDNRWHHEFLEAMRAAIKSTNSKYAAAYCIADRFSKDAPSRKRYRDGTIGETFSFKKLLTRNYIDINTFVHTKDLLEHTGIFDPKLKRLVDWDLILRVTSLVKPIFVPRVLVDYFSCIADNTITMHELTGVSFNTYYKKYTARNGPFSCTHDSIPYTWHDLPEDKHRNFWVHLNQKKLNTLEYTAWAYPFVLQIEPSNACNLECPLCPVGRKMLGRKTRHMSFEEFKRIVDDMSSYLLLLVLWDWGEPFMNPELPKMIRYASEHDIRTVTSTNAHFLGDDVYLERILTSGLSTLIVSVDSAEQDTYQVYRKKGNLNKVLSDLQKLVEMKKSLASTTRINMRMVIMKQNEHELASLRRLARKIGVDWFSVKTLNPSCGVVDMDDKLVPVNPKYRRFAYAPHTNKRIRIQGVCQRPWQMANIFSNGDVVPCCYDYDAEMKVGNVFETPFTQIWNGVAYRSLRKRIYKSRESIEKCRNCWVSFKLSNSPWFSEFVDLTKKTLSQSIDGIKNRLRQSPAWPILRAGKRMLQGRVNWIARIKRMLYFMSRSSVGATPPLSSWIRSLDLPLQEDSLSGWKSYDIFNGSTCNLQSLSSHVSVLSPGKAPHQPHEHAEEEILIMLSGEANLVIVDTQRGQSERRQSLQPGSFVYYPAWQRHTIHNEGTQSATYLMFKWLSKQVNSDRRLDISIVQFPDERHSYLCTDKKGFATTNLLEGSTQYLRKLHCHQTTLQPGCGYAPHVDAYDVAIVVLRGSVETLSQRVGVNGVIFYAAGDAHGMKNVGTLPAIYLVFEFHSG